VEGWQKWYGDVSQSVATVQNELTQYKEAYGDLTPGEQRRVAQEQGMSKAQFEQVLDDKIRQRDVAALKFVDDLTDLKIEHRQNFSEKLDTQAVYAIAGEKNLPLDVAYNLYVKDRVEEKRKTDYDTAIKAAKDEGYREAVSRHNIPMVPSTSEV